MASLVVSASTGVLSSLLSKLSVLLSDQYMQRKGVRRDIELLSCELTNMNAALEKLADMENLDGQTKVWRDKDAERLVGIDGPREEITKLLIEEGGKFSGQLKVVSIVGFGGLGKTTFANQEAAENCLNELINRSMIEPCFNAHGEVQACQVHDLMLDLIISKCKKENFITIIDRNFTMIGALEVRRISHQFRNRDIALVFERMNQSQVRSYNFFPAADCMPPLSKFELLRVLDMDQLDSYRYVRPESTCLDLSSINHLFLLRYLRVAGFRLVQPKKFGKLKHLMTVDIESTILCPMDQFSDFTSLSSLRHLTLPRRVGNVVRINGLSELCNLCTLIHFCIRTSNSVECIRDLGDLTSLRELIMIYYSWPGDVEDDPDTILTASLDKLGNSNLRLLYFHKYQFYGRPLSTQFWSNFITRPKHLQRLRLDGHIIPKVPNCIVHADRLAYLEELRVQELGRDGIQILNIDLDGREEGTMQLPEGSPVGGIENLASLEKIYLLIRAKCVRRQPRRLKVESACREAIRRHPKSQSMLIYSVYCNEFDEIGHEVQGSQED
ncbi:unnamed protein product [Miscanthus lutarioriparius]|uniref:Rx N-terminal domain-containing protein n=1 Tax=Miscanthus lutarioriparius TaxID=422564 RepID=A0A811RSX9_9POAL|nr:unnamed protein product [Miscanthus lutarioriparius]